MAIPENKKMTAGSGAAQRGATATSSSVRVEKKAADRTLVKEDPENFPLTRKSFIYMIVAGAMIVAGFLLMLGGGTTTEGFNEDIFSTRRIVIGPTVAFLGFVFMGVAIVIRPGKGPKGAGSRSEE